VGVRGRGGEGAEKRKVGGGGMGLAQEQGYSGRFINGLTRAVGEFGPLDDDMLTPIGYLPPPTQQPTRPTAHTAHSQHCRHTALPSG